MVCRVAVVLVLTMVAGCSSSSEQPASPPTTVVPAPVTSVVSLPAPIPIGLRIDRRVSDDATADFATVLQTTLIDARGWEQAGFSFTFGTDSPYVVVLAEGREVDALCRPYDTYGLFSCQIGPVVALNADRWRTATPEWTGTVAEYRQMLINHEVGHLLGLHHPVIQCPGVGQPAPVMAQQSTELDGCRPNPWPLPWEIACAAQHVEPLAPGYEPDAQPTCGPDG